MPSFGTYDWPIDRLSVQVDDDELVITSFPYDAPSQEIAWVLDGLDGIQRFGVGSQLAPSDLLVPLDVLAPG